MGVCASDCGGGLNTPATTITAKSTAKPATRPNCTRKRLISPVCIGSRTDDGEGEAAHLARPTLIIVLGVGSPTG